MTSVDTRLGSGAHARRTLLPLGLTLVLIASACGGSGRPGSFAEKVSVLCTAYTAKANALPSYKAKNVSLMAKQVRPLARKLAAEIRALKPPSEQRQVAAEYATLIASSLDERRPQPPLTFRDIHRSWDGFGRVLGFENALGVQRCGYEGWGRGLPRATWKTSPGLVVAAGAKERKLPNLPAAGVIVGIDGGARLISLGGRPFLTLPGFQLTPAAVSAPGLPRMLQGASGRFTMWALDASRKRLVDVSGGFFFGKTFHSSPAPLGCIALSDRNGNHAYCGWAAKGHDAIIALDRLGRRAPLAPRSNEVWGTMEVDRGGRRILAATVSAQRVALISTTGRSVRWLDGYALGFAPNGDALVFQTRHANGGESRIVALGQGTLRVVVENVSGAAMWGDTGRPFGPPG